ncbi:MAG: YHS domain-containing (seleno)protein [Beijerinckiaceae bacterium]
MNRRNLVLGALAIGAGGLVYFTFGMRRSAAGPIHIDSTTFAAGGRDVVAYFKLPNAGNQTRGVPGSRRFTTNWNGATFAFASAENRDLFVANPMHFAPQFDGHCAWAAGQGYKAPGSPDVWSIIDGKLYLNYSHEVRGRWEKGMTQQIAAANTNWIKLGKELGTTGDAEDYTPSAAPVQ